MKPFFVYMLRCGDGSFYTGHTDDLEKRFAEHQQGTFSGHTARRRPVTLAYACEFGTREEAIARETQLKGWSRAKKDALIHEDWRALMLLSRSRPSTVASPCEATLRANGPDK